eukprot:2745861-Amphidinium_carterae.2
MRSTHGGGRSMSACRSAEAQRGKTQSGETCNHAPGSTGEVSPETTRRPRPLRWDEERPRLALVSHRKLSGVGTKTPPLFFEVWGLWALPGPLVVACVPEFEGIERGLDGRTIKAMRTLAGKRDYSAQSAVNAACGG